MTASPARPWWHGLRPVIVGYITALPWIGIWLWNHQWKPIIILLLIHAYGTLTFWLGTSWARRVVSEIPSASEERAIGEPPAGAPPQRDDTRCSYVFPPESIRCVRSAERGSRTCPDHVL
jgi:hypothetical protein